jgi:O-6-methylguanine DNA methyltransferase
MTARRTNPRSDASAALRLPATSRSVTATDGAPALTDDAPGRLASLAMPAPAHLPQDVLVELGLADRMAPIESPLGTLWVAWNGRGVSEVEQADDGESAVARHAARTGRRTMLASSLPANLHRAISRRLAGERRVRIPLDLRGRTEFEVAVWTKALDIPHGEVRPYGWIAAEIGHPKAVRAVGTALGHNPVPLIVPCHRVVRTDGSIGRYSLGGADNKRVILAAEGLDPDALEAAARRGERLAGSTTTRIFCWPTCRHARRVQDRYRVSFRSSREARAAGYRACRVCKPTEVGAAA